MPSDGQFVLTWHDFVGLFLAVLFGFAEIAVVVSVVYCLYKIARRALVSIRNWLSSHLNSTGA